MNPRKLALGLSLAVLALSIASAAAPPDTGIRNAFTPTPLTQRNGLSGHSVVAARAQPTSAIGGAYVSSFRGDMHAERGGLYAGSQTVFAGFDAQVDMASQGQAIGYFTEVFGLGKGNTQGANFIARCYGGGETTTPSDSTPVCSAMGEQDVYQGNLIFHATVTGSPASGATTISYTPIDYETYAGGRMVLNRSRGYKFGSAGATTGISAVATCNEGVATYIVGASGITCNAHCPAGTGTQCTAIKFQGTPWSGVTHSNYYFEVDVGQDDFYGGACHGDDVALADTGGTCYSSEAAPCCVGHYYKVGAVDSSSQITLQTIFDSANLTIANSGAGASWLALEGVEALGVNTTTHQLTLPANGVAWQNGDVLYSPPSHVVGMAGAVIVLSKQYKTGSTTAQSDGIYLSSIGPKPIENAIHVTGISGGGAGTVIRVDQPANSGAVGLWFVNDIGPATATPNGDATCTKNYLSVGASTLGRLCYDPTSAALVLATSHVNVEKGVYNNGGGFKHQRVTTGSISASTTTAVTVTWVTAFADANYTPRCTVKDASDKLTVPQIHDFAAGTVTANVTNTDAGGAHTGTLLCDAVHD